MSRKISKSPSKILLGGQSTLKSWSFFIRKPPKEMYSPSRPRVSQLFPSASLAGGLPGFTGSKLSPPGLSFSISHPRCSISSHTTGLWTGGAWGPSYMRCSMAWWVAHWDSWNIAPMDNVVFLQSRLFWTHKPHGRPGHCVLPFISKLIKCWSEAYWLFLWVFEGELLPSRFS